MGCLGQRRKSRGRARREKERRPPLPFAFPPRAASKKINNDNWCLLRRLASRYKEVRGWTRGAALPI